MAHGTRCLTERGKGENLKITGETTVKYMTFPASCSFCCVANMLEHFRVDVSDSDVVIGADLPYRFRFDSEEDRFSTGAMLQLPEDYNRFLQKYGIRFVDSVVKKEDVLDFLLPHAPCMIGLTSDFGKHAMVFTEKTAEGYRFLNPHRENDGQADQVALKESEVLERTSNINHIGYLEEGIVDAQGEADHTEIVVKDYRLRFLAFCQTKQTAADVAAWRDRLLRPVALDMPVMMSMVGETTLAGKLAVLQSQIFQILRMDACVPSDTVDLDLFEEVIAEYLVLVKSRSR